MSLWDEPKRSRHHYADAIIKQSKHNSVIWVNRPYIFSDNSSYNGVEEISDQLSVLHLGSSLLPKWLPRTIEELFNLDVKNKRMLILSFLKEKVINNYITVCFDYKGLKILKSLSIDSPKYYFCNDFFGFWPKLLYQKGIGSFVDGIIATDPRLANYFKNINKNVLFLPHGLWHLKSLEYSKNAKVRSLVYSGTLNFSIDYDLLLSIVQNTDFELHLVGPIIEIDENSLTKLNNLLNQPNVIYYGNLPDISERNDIVLNCDICLLPYKKSFNGFVLKFFDYLNLGKPILSTNFNTYWIDEYKRFVSFFDSKISLKLNIENTFSNHNNYVFDEMRFLASNSTWENRLNVLNNFLNNPGFVQNT